jgi:hypothetical protein
MFKTLATIRINPTQTLKSCREKITRESNLNKSDNTTAKIQTGLDNPLCLAIKRNAYTFNKHIRQGTTSNRLKLKGLGGAFCPPRRACSIVDKPDTPYHLLLNQSIYRRLQQPLFKALKVSKSM